MGLGVEVRGFRGGLGVERYVGLGVEVRGFRGGGTWV